MIVVVEEYFNERSPGKRRSREGQDRLGTLSESCTPRYKKLFERSDPRSVVGERRPHLTADALRVTPRSFSNSH